MVWPLINSMATGFLTVSDEEAGEAVRVLDRGASGVARLRVGESGAAGLAGLIRAAEGQDRARLALDQTSKVLLFATEGPTDLSVWSGSR
jgi:diaminopropionate ammonia-lyase